MEDKGSDRPKKWMVVQPEVDDWEQMSEEQRDVEAGRIYEALMAALGRESHES